MRTKIEYKSSQLLASLRLSTPWVRQPQGFLFVNPSLSHTLPPASVWIGGTLIGRGQMAAGEPGELASVEATATA